MGGKAGHPARTYPARQTAAECLYRALQPGCALRLAGAIPVRFHRGGPGIRDLLALDIQSRAVEHGPGRHHPQTEVGTCRLASTSGNSENGGNYVTSGTGQKRSF